jgi:uncharacterized protein
MLKFFADWLSYQILSLTPGTFLAEAVNFFIYDTIKIFLLLIVIIFLVSIIRTFFHPDRAKAILSYKKTYIGNILASLLGIVTPFCTCSAIPLFLGFVEAGIPLGVTFSFLVASPMINEVALIMLWGMFGWRIALLYIGSGLIIAILSGIIIGKLKVDNLIENLHDCTESFDPSELPQPGTANRLRYARNYTRNILRKVWLYVLLGIGLGAWIHGYAPADLISVYAGKDNLFAVPLATFIGIPLYSNAAGVIPIVKALVEKGVGLGTALAFMMAVTGLSLPEFLILRRVMKLKLILIFATVVGIGIIITGYLFNFIIK